ncbi:MAG: alpha/beta fold hydrolase [Thermoleophilia bacterium]|nr:alpha/beta fold hydrolase [Thermoleophilia bacterium]
MPTPPAALVTLIDRFDPEAIDVTSDKARIRLLVDGEAGWDAVIQLAGIELRPLKDVPCDAELSADGDTWDGIAEDFSFGMEAFHRGQLRIRRNLHLGVGFLTATSGIIEPGRLEFGSVETPVGRLSILEAGQGEPVVCIPGLGGTKASFMTTVAALSDERRVIALDLPGFGDSDKPLDAAYDAPFFAGAVTSLLDEMEIDSAHLIGNSMGGRVAIETGLLHSERVDSMVLLCPALAWLSDRRWRWLLQAPLPKLGLLQPAPKVITERIIRNLVPGAKEGWTAAGVDEFLRSFLTPRGRVAFYESARNIYLDEPHGEQGLWTRLARLSPPALFVWGVEDQLVPMGFRKHVEKALPSAEHLVLECGHVPQLEEPEQTHEAIAEFFN